jgi:hypothetical protein
MAIKEDYVLVHRDTRRQHRAAIFVCAVLSAALIVLMGVAVSQSWRSINGIVAAGDCSKVAYERAMGRE